MRTLLHGAAAAALGFGLATPAGAQEAGAAATPAGADVNALTMAATGCNENNLANLRFRLNALLPSEGQGRGEQIQQDAYRLLARAQEQLAEGNIRRCARIVDTLTAILPGVTIGATEEDAALPGAVQQAITGRGGEGLGVAPGEDEILLVRACETGDFSWWRTRLAQSADQIGFDDERDDAEQAAYQLLADAQTAESYAECAESIALLEDLLPGITVGTVTGITTGAGVTLPGGVRSEVVPNPAVEGVAPRVLTGVQTGGAADIAEACRTGNFAAWRIQLNALTGDAATDEQVQQDAYRLLVSAQDAGSPLSCRESLAALASILQGVTVGTLTRDEVTYPADVPVAPVQSDVAVPVERQ